MLKKLLPVVFLLLGLGAGAGAGIFLRPSAEPEGADAHASPAAGGHSAPAEDGHGAPKPDGHGAPAKDGHAAASEHGAKSAKGGHGEPTDPEAHDFVKLNNQFIVPVLEHGRVTSMVIMSLTLEVGAGGRDRVFALEPKLRDAFLRVMFDHANAGGFDGNFTSGSNMLVLRDALKEVAFKTLGPILLNVLIIDLVRQDA